METVIEFVDQFLSQHKRDTNNIPANKHCTTSSSNFNENTINHDYH